MRNTLQHKNGPFNLTEPWQRRREQPTRVGEAGEHLLATEQVGQGGFRQCCVDIQHIWGILGALKF